MMMRATAVAQAGGAESFGFTSPVKADGFMKCSSKTRSRRLVAPGLPRTHRLTTSLGWRYLLRNAEGHSPVKGCLGLSSVPLRS